MRKTLILLLCSLLVESVLCSKYDSLIGCLNQTDCKIPYSKPLVKCIDPKKCNLESRFGEQTLRTGDTCQTENLENGVCVPQWNCANEVQEKQGTYQITLRFGEENTGNSCSYLSKCCPRNKLVQSEEQKVVPVETVDEKATFKCGKRNVGGVGFKIDSDLKAQFGEFPWMVSILSEKYVPSDGLVYYKYICGGSLIHPKLALTAGHCVYNYLNSTSIVLKVRAGEWDTQTEDEIFAHRDSTVRKIIVHENYTIDGLKNNFALLVLDEPFETQPHIDIVCLSLIKLEYNNCYVTGWGSDVYGLEEIYQVLLKKLKLPLVEHSKCQNSLKKVLGPKFKLHESSICAGGEAGKDACKGDGGSPLVCSTKENPDIFFQVGIVAWGVGCGMKDIPGVYTDVTYMATWIHETAALLGISTGVGGMFWEEPQTRFNTDNTTAS